MQTMLTRLLSSEMIIPTGKRALRCYMDVYSTVMSCFLLLPPLQ